jgi:hypothetical protein
MQLLDIFMYSKNNIGLKKEFFIPNLMNFRGIQKLVASGITGPRRQSVGSIDDKIDKKALFNGNENGATIMLFDKRDSIYTKQLGVRRYNISEGSFDFRMEELVDAMNSKGLEGENIGVVTHETYNPRNIQFSGMIARETNEYNTGWLYFEAVQGLREEKKEFNPEQIITIPISRGRLMVSQRIAGRQEIKIPARYVAAGLTAINQLPDNPHIDWAVYDDGQMFFHDLFYVKL